jgi:Zn-dependent peptidase ImmA (M78 family)
MSRNAYYEQMKQLARSTREKYGLRTPRVQRSDLRRIYRDQGIRIDLWPHKLREVRGAYFFDEFGPTVLLAKGLPEDPMVFTMCHELKHHIVDRDMGVAYCSAGNVNEHIEIGAEVFAAELIFPEADFVNALAARGISTGTCTPEAIVRLKRETRTTLSYAGLAKRATFLRLAPTGTLEGIRWRKLEVQIFGEPPYKRFLRRRAR